MGVTVSSFSTNGHIRALEIGDNNTTGPALNRGIPGGYAPLGRTGPDKGETFLDTPTHTRPQSKSPSPIPFHRGYAMGRGRWVGRKGGGGVLHH